MNAPTGRMKQRPILGIALVVLMAVCFAGMDAAVKYVGQFLPVILILWVRYAVQVATIAGWIAGAGSKGFRASRPKFQILRGLLMVAASAMGFISLQYIPMAEFTAMLMLSPIFVTVLASWLLRERVSLLKWMLVAGGFLGALVIIRPGTELFGWAVLLPIASAVLNAFFQVLTRKLSGLESPFTTHFYTGAIGTVVLTPLLFMTAVDIPDALLTASGAHIGLLLAVGLLATVAHLLLIFALGFAPTATLMPFVYLQIVAAAGFGWFVFRHVPDSIAWAGMAVISACGATSAWLNVREASQKRASAVHVHTMVD